MTEFERFSGLVAAFEGDDVNPITSATELAKWTRENQGLVRQAILERDVTLLTKEFLEKTNAKLESRYSHEILFTIEGVVRIYGLATNGPKCWNLFLDQGKGAVINNPSIGDLRTQCRLYKVKLEIMR